MYLSLNLIFDEMLFDEAKQKLWVLITEPGGSVTEENLLKSGSPQSLKNLEKLLKIELTGMWFHWGIDFATGPRSSSFMRNVKKCWVLPYPGLALLHFHLHLFTSWPCAPWLSHLPTDSQKKLWAGLKTIAVLKSITCPAWNTSPITYFHNTWTIIWIKE